MKKTIYLILVILIANTTMGQLTKPKPVGITKPNADFLSKLQQTAIYINSKTITEKNVKGLSDKQILFINLLKTATNATTWGKTNYKTFIQKASTIITTLGIGPPDDGGEIFIGNPDDGGEVFASTATFTKAVKSICDNKCVICSFCYPW